MYTLFKIAFAIALFSIAPRAIAISTGGDGMPINPGDGGGNPVPVPPFANDDFIDSQALPFETSFQIKGTTVGATQESGDPVFQVVQPQDSYSGTVWYSWIAPRSGLVQIRSKSDNSGFLSVFVGDELSAGTYINFNGAENLQFYAVAGITYHFCIYDGIPQSSSPGRGESGAAFALSLNYRQWLPDDTEFNEPYRLGFFEAPLEFNQAKYDGVLLSDTIHIKGNGDLGFWISWTAPVTGTVKFMASGTFKRFERVLNTVSGSPRFVETAPRRTRTSIGLSVGGNSIDNAHWGRSAINALGFRCYKGVTYRLHLQNEAYDSLFFRIRATGR